MNFLLSSLPIIFSQFWFSPITTFLQAGAGRIIWKLPDSTWDLFVFLNSVFPNASCTTKVYIHIFSLIQLKIANIFAIVYHISISKGIVIQLRNSIKTLESPIEVPIDCAKKMPKKCCCHWDMLAWFNKRSSTCTPLPSYFILWKDKLGLMTPSD